MSNEEKFIINVLFSSRENQNINFSNLKIDNLIKISSNHLIIPSLYTELNKKIDLIKIPKKLYDYFGYIFNENLKRNKTIIEEIRFVNTCLRKKNILPVFLKGAALSILELHGNIGSRMIGDIDILVPDSQYDETFDILVKNGYKSKKIRFFEKKAIHKPRLVSNNKLFAVEVHNKLLINDKNNLLNPKKILKDAINIKGIQTPNFHDLILHNIYSYEINDRANLFLNYSFRNLYDISVILKNNESLLLNKKNKYFDDYFSKAKYIGIDFKNINHKTRIMTSFRFNLKKRYKIFNKIDNGLSWAYLKIVQKPSQLIEFLVNKEYREYVLKKLIKFL